MRDFKRAVWKLGITVIQLNEVNPQTGHLELRRFATDGSWIVTGVPVPAIDPGE